MRVVYGKNLGHEYPGGDIFVEITTTTYDNINVGGDMEMDRVNSNIKTLSTLNERTPRIRAPNDHNGTVIWESEKNLGFFSKNVPVNINFTVK